MAEHHHIPVPRERIVAALLAETQWVSEQAQKFEQFAFDVVAGPLAHVR